jgi:hypothetical protein
MAWHRLLIVLVALGGANVSAAQDRSFFDAFAENVGRTTFAVAWPTASYEGARFEGAEAGNGVVYAVFRLYGRSGFDGSSLWTDCTVTFKGLSPINVQFGRNNGTIPPGLAAGLMAQLLQDLDKGAKKANQDDGSQTWTVTDKCTDQQGIYIRFFDPKTQWAWPDWETHYEIERGKSRTFTLAVKPGQLICYGARPAKNKKRYWGISLTGKEGCESCCYQAGVTNIPIELTCD